MTGSTFPMKRLIDAGVQLHDCEHKTPPGRSSGYPYVAIPNIVGGRLDLSNVRLINDEELREWTRRTAPTEGDIILTRRGRVGDSAVVPRGLRCAIGQNLVILRSDGSEIDQSFLRWLMRGPFHQDQVAKFLNMGAVFDSLNCADIPRFEVPVPPLAEQQTIAEVLGALDDKIESNRRLAEMCRDLIRLELEVREDATWCEAPVSRLARFVNGGAYTSGASGTGRMVIRIAELTKGAGGSTVYNDIDVPDDHMARPGDLLMAWSGSLGIHIWLGEEAVINQHIFKVVPDGVPAWLVFDRLERVMPEFRQIAADKATTMGHIKRHHLDDALVRVPVGQALAELDALLSPNWSRGLAADIESRTLSSLRDLLLPELLSGRLRVPVAEQSVR